MYNINLLDCTLRDGGYINNWNFGNKNILAIKDNLVKSGVEYLELGYLTNKKEYSEDYTCFNYVSQIDDIIEKNDKKSSVKYICMINYGEYDIEKIPDFGETNLFGIRVAFHKHDMVEALKFSKELKKKGYNVFVQPMLTMSYSNEELSYFLQEVNKLQPYAVYLVDSFGYMAVKDIVDKMDYFLNFIDENIILGFHPHNNLQLAFSNSLAFIDTIKNRKCILDSSIYGMGRGAGNLNTELIMKHLNNNFGTIYNINPLLYIVDNILEKIRKEKFWGYSLVYYLSAIYKCHPNYAKFYNKFSTLSISDMSEILSLISDEKRTKVDEVYAQELYETHFSNNCDESESIKKLKNIIGNKKVLLVGSGSSINISLDKIKNIKEKEDVFIIAVNNFYECINPDAVFISNRKRYSTLIDKIKNKFLITTSNIKKESDDICTFDYKKNLAREIKVSDNALLLILNILGKVTSSKIYLAGFDGFTFDFDENYYSSELSYVMDKNRVEELNATLKEYINLYNKKLDINFITPSLYID